MPSSEALLRAVNVVKRFGGVEVLRAVSIFVDKGAVVSSSALTVAARRP